MSGPSPTIPQLVSGNVGLTDGVLTAALLNSAPASDTGQVGIAVRVISSLGGASGGGLTDTQLRATPVPVSLASVPSHAVTNAGTFSVQVTSAPTTAVTGTFWQATQPVSIAASVAVTGTFWQATQPVSGTFFQATQPVSVAATVAVSDTTNDVARSTRLKPADTLAGVTTVGTVTTLGTITNALPAGSNLIGQAQVPPATLSVTAVSGANATVTCTLPAVASQFHYISRIVIERVATTAIVGSATLTYTSTNLPGSWSRTTGNAAPVGVQQKDVDECLGSELKSSVVNTATTIVAPAAGATGIVRITVYYRTAA